MKRRSNSAKFEIVDCRIVGIVVSENRYGASRLRSLANHYKFIENNLIPGCGSNEKLSRTSFARFSGADFDRSRAPARSGLSKRTSIPGSPEVESILPDSNMEIQIQMYGNAFAPITLINHGYAAILILFRSSARSSYEVISRLIAPAGATCDKPKIAPPRSLIHTERNRRSEPLPVHENFTRPRVNELQRLPIKATNGFFGIVPFNFTAANSDRLRLADKCRARERKRERERDTRWLSVPRAWK